MENLNPPTRSAKDSPEGYRYEVADDGPTQEEFLFLLAHTLCERLGLRCPAAGRTRDGLCVATWSPCPYDARQPRVTPDNAAELSATPESSRGVKAAVGVKSER